ncbi:hypothetical protein Sjap_013458 [Stephania japonica]|uniref:Uncharacterized protein n=1 Tax=Stephania japonica TaxID=461633 RepID=A0AAP0J0F1_9MAGN
MKYQKFALVSLLLTTSEGCGPKPRLSGVLENLRSGWSSGGAAVEAVSGPQLNNNSMKRKRSLVIKLNTPMAMGDALGSSGTLVSHGEPQ